MYVINDLVEVDTLTCLLMCSKMNTLSSIMGISSPPAIKNCFLLSICQNENPVLWPVLKSESDSGSSAKKDWVSRPAEGFLQLPVPLPSDRI